MPHVTFRPATAADSEFAYQTKRAAFRPYVEMVWRWDEDAQRKLHDRRFSEQEFRIVRESGVDVGVVALVRGPDCYILNQLFILPVYQSRGIGEACMMLIIREADEQRLPVRLQVLKVNERAIAFYRRLGFAQTGESDAHVRMERTCSAKESLR